MDQRKTKSHVGPWQLGKTLGRGSTGRVRLAKHSVSGQLAAVKIVPKSLVSANSNNGLPYGIEREVIIMKLIQHPNIMALYDVWENKGELYLVLEYVEGGELFDYLIKKGRLEEREAVNYFYQIIRGVEYCHRYNICHRDLKPENLLLDVNKNIKIADFGMAALEISDKMLETSCGSPHYASPEIVAGRTYHGAPSDIWSCGIILFALLTGHLPFDDDNIRKVLLKVQAGKFTMPSDLSDEAKDLIVQMLQIDPADRIPIKDIFRHPLIVKYPKLRNHKQHNCPAQSSAVRALRSRDDIDHEILDNLQTLWHGESREKIVGQLLSPSPNPEQTFYSLLLKYRQSHGQRKSAKSKRHKKPSRTSSRVSIVSSTSSHRRNVSFNRQRARSGSTSRRGDTSSRTVDTSSRTADTKQKADRTADRTADNKQKADRTADTKETKSTRRIVSEPPHPSNNVVKDSKRCHSQGSELPEIPSLSLFDSLGTASTTTSQWLNYQMPRIFEHDRFADPVESYADSAHDLDHLYQLLDLPPGGPGTGDHNIQCIREDRSHVTPGHMTSGHMTRPRDSSRLDMAGLINNDSFHNDFFSDECLKDAELDLKELQESDDGTMSEIMCPREDKKTATRAAGPKRGGYSTTQGGYSTAQGGYSTTQGGYSTTQGGYSADPETHVAARPPLAERDVNTAAAGLTDNTKPRKLKLFQKLAPGGRRGPVSGDPGGVPGNSQVAPGNSRVAGKAARTGSTDKQPWFMKMLAPKREWRRFESELDVVLFRSVIVQSLVEWQRFGISDLVTDLWTNSVSATISSRNVLRLRSSKFRIEIEVAPSGSVAYLILEKGSSSTFSRFACEIERALVCRGAITANP